MCNAMKDWSFEGKWKTSERLTLDGKRKRYGLTTNTQGPCKQSSGPRSFFVLFSFLDLNIHAKVTINLQSYCTVKIRFLETVNLNLPLQMSERINCYYATYSER